MGSPSCDILSTPAGNLEKDITQRRNDAKKDEMNSIESIPQLCVLSFPLCDFAVQSSSASSILNLFAAGVAFAAKLSLASALHIFLRVLPLRSLKYLCGLCVKFSTMWPSPTARPAASSAASPPCTAFAALHRQTGCLRSGCRPECVSPS